MTMAKTGSVPTEREVMLQRIANYNSQRRKLPWWKRIFTSEYSREELKFRASIGLGC